MRAPAAALVPLLLLAGCGGARTPRTPDQQAADACHAVGDLFTRDSLRRSDVTALATADADAAAAGAAVPHWTGLATAAKAAHTAALAVEASSRQPTSNTEQARIDDAYSAAEASLQRACRGL